MMSDACDTGRLDGSWLHDGKRPYEEIRLIVIPTRQEGQREEGNRILQQGDLPRIPPVFLIMYLFCRPPRGVRTGAEQIPPHPSSNLSPLLLPGMERY